MAQAYWIRLYLLWQIVTIPLHYLTFDTMAGAWTQPNVDPDYYWAEPPCAGWIVEAQLYDYGGRAQGRAVIQLGRTYETTSGNVSLGKYIAVEDDYYYRWVKNVRPQEDPLYFGVAALEGHGDEIEELQEEADEEGHYMPTRIWRYRRLYPGAEGQIPWLEGNWKDKVRECFGGRDSLTPTPVRHGSRSMRRPELPEGARRSMTPPGGHRLYSPAGTRPPQTDRSTLGAELATLRDQLNRSPPPTRRTRQPAREERKDNEREKEVQGLPTGEDEQRARKRRRVVNEERIKFTSKSPRRPKVDEACPSKEDEPTKKHKKTKNPRRIRRSENEVNHLQRHPLATHPRFFAGLRAVPQKWVTRGCSVTQWRCQAN